MNRKNKRLMLLGAIVLLAVLVVCISGVFSIIVFPLLLGVLGLVISIIKKDKNLCVVSLIIFLLGVFGMALFYTLLANSGM